MNYVFTLNEENWLLYQQTIVLYYVLTLSCYMYDFEDKGKEVL